jgi:hypothetical protein
MWLLHALLVILVSSINPEDSATARIRSEKIICLFYLNRALDVSSETILGAILREMPQSRWQLTDVENFRSEIIQMTTVPVWFHETVFEYVQKKNERNSYSDPRLETLVVQKALEKGDPRWAHETFVGVMLRQWVMYCVDPLIFLPPWGESVCFQENEFWKLSKHSRDSLTMEMALVHYERLRGSRKNSDIVS